MMRDCTQITIEGEEIDPEDYLSVSVTGQGYEEEATIEYTIENSHDETIAADVVVTGGYGDEELDSYNAEIPGGGEYVGELEYEHETEEDVDLDFCVEVENPEVI